MPKILQNQRMIMSQPEAISRENLLKFGYIHPEICDCTNTRKITVLHLLTYMVKCSPTPGSIMDFDVSVLHGDDVLVS